MYDFMQTTIVPLEEELQSSYIDYAMSVIIGRAIPDARDGLKPAQRRILYTMYNLNNFHNQPTKKSARITGDTMGRLHPHGDIAIYDTLVRMAQPFSMNHTLVEGQGNFGCFTKDTQIKLTDGRNINFEQLIKEQKAGKRHWTFAFNTSKESIEIAEIKNPRCTRRNAELIEVILDNDKRIKCTPDHRFLLRDGQYKQAEELVTGDSLMPLYMQLYEGAADRKLKDYEMVLQPIQNEWKFVHHLADEWNLKENVYARARGRIRHHLDFDKKNNNPDNITRLDWEEHWRIHYTSASWRHKNGPAYAKKLAEGRKKFIERNHEFLSHRASDRNKKNWKKPSYRRKHIRLAKNLWANDAYRNHMRNISSQNLKEKWENKDFCEHISKAKSKEMKNRWKSEVYRGHMSKIMKETSLKLWSSPHHKQRTSNIMKEIAKNPERVEAKRAVARPLWNSKDYLSKFSRDHFGKIAKKGMSDEEYRSKQKEKTKKQRQDPNLRANVINNVKKSNLRRIKQNPMLMNDITQLAKRALHKKWQDPSYKTRVIRSKILGLTHKLISKYPNITPSIYESERANNRVPKLANALKYFPNFGEIIEKAEFYNHKVKNVLLISEHQDVYDLTIDNQHNFALSVGIFVHNSIDGDPPAAMRYTEVRLTRLAEEMLNDLDKDTVDMMPNFDNTEKEPTILPAKVPNLLINGASGIAVGVATNIPPHNLAEVCDAIVYGIKNKEAGVDEILNIIKGPDFPTGGTAVISEDTRNGYKHGRGQLLIRAKVEIDEAKKRLLIKEIPYNVNKSALIQGIAELAREKRVQGIKDIRDESDKSGINVVVELKSEEDCTQVLNILYKHTQLEVTYPIINLAVVGKSLRSFNILQLISTFIEYRTNVILRRSNFELKQASERLHIVEGLLIAITSIDEIIKTIKGSEEVSDARKNLIDRFKLTEKQANAILDMKLGRLTHLENASLNNEKEGLEKKISYYSELIRSPQKVEEIIIQETAEIKRQYGRPRKTELVQSEGIAEIRDEDMISNEKVTVILTSNGYVKRMSTKIYKEQARGGKGVIAINLKEGDYVKRIVTCNNKDYLVCISNTGRAYWLKAYNIPETSRYSEGKAIVNLLNLKDEKIIDLLDTRNFVGSKIAFLTAKGLIKKTRAELFSRPRSSGVRAITLNASDEIVDTAIYTNEKYLIIVTQKGKSIKFDEGTVRFTGRAAMGVRGIRVPNDSARNIIAANEEGSILSVTENGYGKITPVNRYRTQSRGGKGVINLRANEKTGNVSKALFVMNEEHLLLISSKGISITIPISSIRVTGRAASGVRLMKLEPNTKVADARLLEEEAQPKAEQLPLAEKP